MANVSELITDFLQYLEIEKGRSQKTIANYDRYLRTFSSDTKVVKPQDITIQKVRSFRLKLNRQENIRGGNLKSNTQNYYLIALRSFLKYCAKEDVTSLAPEKIELAKTLTRQVDFLDGTDLSALLSAPSQLKKSQDKINITQLRDKAILELFFSTGLRVSELANLKISQVNLNKDEFTIRGKGGKLRIVFLTEQARHALREYINQRDKMSEYLFVSHDRAGKKREDLALTPRSIQRLIQKYARMAGITKHVTPHTLRHSFATDLLRNGADIRSVQAMLGHSSITTTQIYTHVTNPQLKEIHRKFHGRSAQ